MAEHPRTETARDTDDSDLIENLETGNGSGSTSSNTLGREVASRDDLDEVLDPDRTERPTKQNDIDANVARNSDRRGQNG